MRFANASAMTIARSSEFERKTTQSGKANAASGCSSLSGRSAAADPLTGWNGSGDTGPQVRMNFANEDAAIAYCEKHGLTPRGPRRHGTLKIQAYADNFG